MSFEDPTIEQPEISHEDPPKEKNTEIKFSPEEEALAFKIQQAQEQEPYTVPNNAGEDVFKKMAEEAKESEDKLMAKADEKLIQFEGTPSIEKVAALRDYFGKDLSGDQEELAEFFLRLVPEKLESVLGKDGVQASFGLITERNNLFRQLEENNLSETELKKMKEKDGYAMLPRQLNNTLNSLESVSLSLSSFFQMQHVLYEKTDDDSGASFREFCLNNVKRSFLELNEENEARRDRVNFERGKNEKTMKIENFEHFDFPDIKGREIIEAAVKILPRELLSTNIDNITYRDEIRPIQKEYGFEGKSFATFSPIDDKKGEIVFYKTTEQESQRTMMSYIREIPRVLAHEWGHGIDPRVIDQQDLSMKDQLRMVVDWERVRAKEPEWSTYVAKINNPDAKTENTNKSIESFAESCAAFLEDPYNFRDLHYQRYRFFSYWIGRRFPEFDTLNQAAIKHRRQETYSFVPKAYNSMETK